MTLFQRFRVAMAAMLLAAMPIAALQAQDAEMKPVAVLSVAPVDSIIKDVQYVSELVGQGDAGRMVSILAAPMLQGIDRNRPIGAVVMTDGQQFVPTVFVPVTDIDSVMLIIKEQFGPPQDVGGDVKLLPTPVPVFVKQVGDWAFLASDKDQLATTPADPAKMLGTLPSDYDLALTAYLKNVPQMYVDIMMAQVKQGLDASLVPEPGETDEEFEARRDQTKEQIAELERLLQSMEDLTLGYNIDAANEISFCEVSYTVTPGSEVAEMLAANENVSTNFAGFAKDSAAISLQLTQVVPQKEIDRSVTSLQNALGQVKTQIENSGELEGEELDAANRIVELMFDSLIETIKTGKVDSGFMVDLSGDNITILLGGAAADGRRVEDALKELVKIAEESGEELPPVKWDAEVYQDVRMHVLEIPTAAAPPELQDAFGENLVVVVGIADTAFYMSAGSDAVASLKSAIDESMQGPKEVEQMTIKIALKPILEEIKRFDDGNKAVTAMIDALEDNADKVLLYNDIEGNKAKGRFQIDNGIIKAIAAAVQAGNDAADEEEMEFGNDF